jgi:hypothetical protein
MLCQKDNERRENMRMEERENGKIKDKKSIDKRKGEKKIPSVPPLNSCGFDITFVISYHKVGALTRTFDGIR